MSIFSKWSQRQPEKPAASSAPQESVSELPTTTKVLPKFLAALSQVQTPVLLDLGPVVGQNVAFFGDRLACKILVEDFFAVIETYARADNRAMLMDALVNRLGRVNGPVDGILCWDLFDFLDRRSAPPVAAALTQLLKPNGLIYGFFGMRSGTINNYTRFIVESPTEFKHRLTPAAPVARTVFVTRDITKMFAGMAVTETVLLKNSAQEVMLKRTG